MSVGNDYDEMIREEKRGTKRKHVHDSVNMEAISPSSTKKVKTSDNSSYTEKGVDLDKRSTDNVVLYNMTNEETKFFTQYNNVKCVESLLVGRKGNKNKVQCNILTQNYASTDDQDTLQMIDEYVEFVIDSITKPNTLNMSKEAVEMK